MQKPKNEGGGGETVAISKGKERGKRTRNVTQLLTLKDSRLQKPHQSYHVTSHRITSPHLISSKMIIYIKKKKTIHPSIQCKKSKSKPKPN